MAHRSGKWLASLMPGIFLIGYNIGTGSLTAMSKAGANYGTGILAAGISSHMPNMMVIPCLPAT